MFRRTLKRTAMFVPPIRRLKDERDAALKQVAELTRLLEGHENVSATAPLTPSVDLDALVNRSVEKSLSMIREELTPLPRFSYHLPLDYEQKTLPPHFDPARLGCRRESASSAP